MLSSIMRTVFKNSLVAALLLIGGFAHATEQRYHLEIDRTYDTSKGERIIVAHSAWYRFTLACQLSDRGTCSDPDVNRTYVLVLDNRAGVQKSVLLNSSNEKSNISGDLSVQVLSMETN
jgi:hypothetical protein